MLLLKHHMLLLTSTCTYLNESHSVFAKKIGITEIITIIAKQPGNVFHFGLLVMFIIFYSINKRSFLCDTVHNYNLNCLPLLLSGNRGKECSLI